MTAAVAIGGVLLLAMIGVSCYGWLTLPADARVPVHFGPASYNNFVPKRFGLVMHPVAGAVVFVLITFVGRGHPATDRSSHQAPSVILPIVMTVLLIVQLGAIRLARRTSGG